MNIDGFLNRADELEALGERVLQTKHRIEYARDFVEGGLHAEFRSGTLSFIAKIYGIEHPHYAEFEKATQKGSFGGTKMGIGILKAIRNEIAGGWLISMKGLIAAEFFSDFLEMAEYLLEQGYKDPAAVIAGSVLEEHLRQLCKKNSIDTESVGAAGKVRPKKAETFNTELAKANVYTLLDQKQVTVGLDLRNKAAHGRYGEYTSDQVAHMISKYCGIHDENERIIFHLRQYVDCERFSSVAYVKEPR